MKIKRLFCLLALSASLHAAGTCFFIPPKGWEIADPDKISPRVHICFLGTSSKGLRPSMNLATEAVNISLDKYIEAIRKIHISDPNSKWRDLGKCTTLMGAGRLTELETPTPSGMVRMVQLVTIQDNIAYILTASALKEEFPKYYKVFDTALRSLQTTPDLAACYPSKKSELHELIQAFTKKKIEWKPFEEKIIKDFTEMGPYWQILLLKEQSSFLKSESP